MTSVQNMPPPVAHPDITYQIGKYVFTVSPVYSENSNRNIHGILLDLMKNEARK